MSYVDKSADSMDAELKSENPFGKFTFEDFVVGECNRFAYIAAVFVTDKPGNQKTNPLLLSGEVGQGKTHLLKAMGNSLRIKHPDKQVLYVTCNDFIDDYNSAVKSKTYEDFRLKYRTADILLFDDIHELINMKCIQSEFYNTVQIMLDNGKQVVVTTESAPGELDRIIDANIANLLISGICFDIQSPDYDTRMKIVNRLLVLENGNLSNETVDYISNNVKKNVSRLIAAVKSICCFKTLANQSEVGLDDVERLLAPYVGGNEKEKKRVTSEKILEAVAGYYGTTREKILSGPKKLYENPSRAAAEVLCRVYYKVPDEECMELFGRAISRTQMIHFMYDTPGLHADVEAIDETLRFWQSSDE